MRNTLLYIASAMLAICTASCTSPVLEPLNENVTIKGSVGNLVGDIYRPEVKGSTCPVAIIYHGLTGNRAEAHLEAAKDSILAAGYAVIRFDYNGHGDSEGLFSNMTLDNELEDSKIIYDYVASLDWVDKSNIALVGHSQGGLLAGVAAADLGKDKVKCAILMAPAACIHRMVLEGQMFGVPADINTMPDSIAFWGQQLGKNYVQSAIDMDVLTRTSGYDGPVCILQGGADKSIRPDAEKYPDYLKDLEYHTLDGLTHCFGEDLETPAKLTAEFLTKHFSK